MRLDCLSFADYRQVFECCRMLKTEHSLYSITVSTFGLLSFGAVNPQDATAEDEGDEEE